MRCGCCVRRSRSRRRRNGCAWSAGSPRHQFAQQRLPTIDELNAAAPDTPVFILHLYDRALLNAAALRVVGYTKDTPNPPGGEIIRDAGGNPNRAAAGGAERQHPLWRRWPRGRSCPSTIRVNSTRHFMRELNRLGVTGALDAGGGFQNYPEDYAVIEQLAADDQLTIRIGYNLFTQKPKQEKEDFLNWTATTQYQQGNDYFRHNGAGEMLVFTAADFEDFRQPRPDMPPEMEGDLEGVVRILAQNRWPWRLHATYDETIARALDVFEKVDRDMPLAGLNWFFDHAETISDRSIDRIAALGGGVAVQHRMAYQGEYFVERYGAVAAEATPPVKRMLDSGLNVSAGSDATRVASYNPWVGLAWLVTGKTVGGLRITPQRHCLDRATALRMWTDKVTWFSNEEGRKGADRGGPACRPDRARPRLFRLRRKRDRGHDRAADHGRRQGGVGRWRLRAARAADAARDARLVAGQPLCRVCRLGRGGARARSRAGPAGGEQLRLREILRRARP